jgi:uncharacterized protein DUF5678
MAGVTVETIVSDIEKLSALDQAKLFRMLATKARQWMGASSATVQGGAKRLPVPEPDPEPNRRWLAAHKSEYSGKWVALDGDRLIVAGETEREVADAAKADGAYLPLIVYIPSPDEPAFVGV